MGESAPALHESRPAARDRPRAPEPGPAGPGPASPAADSLLAWQRGLGNGFLGHGISVPGDAAERHAHARAADVLGAGALGAAALGVGTLGAGAAAIPFLPAGVPAAVAEQAGSGRPLDPADRTYFEPRFGLGLGHVRLHDDERAAALADAADAAAFTVGSHVFLGRGAAPPGSGSGRALLAHELAHVEQRHATPTLWRAPKGRPAKAQRLEVFADSVHYAAQLLAETFTRRAGAGNRLFIGLGSRFIAFFDTNGAPLEQVPVKETQRLSFVPGVYVINNGRLTAITFAGDNPDGPWALEDTGGAGSHIFSREPAAKAAQDTAPAAEEPEPTQKSGLEVLDIDELVGEPDRVRALSGRIPASPTPVFFVPSIEAQENVIDAKAEPGSGTYASPIETRGDGQPANAPPWPVSVDGPRLVPVDADPTFSAHVDWSANGNFSFAAQVISQIGETIHYRWERYDITKYARQQLAADPAGAAAKPPGAEKKLDQRIAEFTTAKAGSGTDVTGTGGARHEFARELDDWWKDTKHAARGTLDPRGDTVTERLSNAAANRLALELAPVSLLVTTLGATLRLIADLFSGPRQQQEIPTEREGIFLIRVITTPAVNEDRQGKPIVRPPSVAAKVTEVAPMDRSVRESLDEPGAQLAELQAQIDLATKAGDQAKADYLRSLLAEAKARFEGSPLQLLQQRRAASQKELEEFRRKSPTLSSYSREREIADLDDQIALAARHEQQRTAGGGAGLAPAVRVNATLISEVTGEQYPLLISAGPMAVVDGKHRWLISDVTNRDGEAYTGMGGTPSAAFLSALTQFGGKAAYGRGRIGVKTAGLGLEKDAPPDFLVDSQPADWALAEKRIDDLVTTLAVLGLFVASAGAAAAIAGAAVAAARLVHRWEAGTLRLDAQTVSDVLGLLGGLGATGQLAAGLRVQKFEKVFALTLEGGATEAQLARAAQALRGAETLARVVELANEAVNYGGLLWGNVSFLDQMVSIAEQERSGALTHAAARRARANAISSAVQNNGLFLAGNVAKGKKGGEPAPERSAPPEKTPAEPAETGGPPAREAVPAGEAAPGEKPAPREEPAPKPEPLPIGDRRATLAELREALPADLRERLTIDPSLRGDTVRVDYSVDLATGLITEIGVRCGPDARPGTVALHTPTVRTMEKFQGFSGRVQRALNWLRELVGIETLDPGNKAQFEAQLEIRKLPGLIEAQLKRMRNMEPNARDLAEAELAKLELQLDQHLRTLELDAAGEGTGYVAAEGLSRAKQRKYAELLEKLREHEPGTDAHKKIRREMYELIGGKLEYPAWESIYNSNVQRARKANAIVAAEQQRLGWGKVEQTVPTGRGEVRRLDIADAGQRRGIEVKAYESGTIYASEEILDEVRRDAKLVKQGWSIKWVLIDTAPSGPLLEALGAAGIIVERRVTQGGTTEFLSRTLPPRKT